MLGERSLDPVLSPYLEHYHQERNHQGLRNHLIVPEPALAPRGQVVRWERLSGCCATIIARPRDAAQYFNSTRERA